MKSFYIGGAYRAWKFEIVDKIPKGYQVWCIGENMKSDIYVPLCQVKPNSYDIIPETLKAIAMKPEEVKIVMKAATRGLRARTELAKQAREIIKKYS